MKMNSCKVAIVGGGPSGLALATELARLGVDDVLLLEREANAGGIPRHCGHSPFGLREFHRILSGPAYTRRLVEQALLQGVSLRTETTVTEIAEKGMLTLSCADGVEGLQAERVILCTGNRETPRSARLVSGSRPLGVVTTGALQSMIYLKHRLPFKRPVIVGSELVSFSALLSCRHAGIKPVTMLESDSRVIAWPAAALLPRLLGCRLRLDTTLEAICGQERVESVTFRNAAGRTESIACDGVVFTGNFVPESSLLKVSHLEMDARSGGPLVDQFGRCSDAAYFACGNLLHPVDTAGWCWAEGRRLAAYVSASLEGKLEPVTNFLQIEPDSPSISYFTPQRIVLPDRLEDSQHPGLQIRFNQDSGGRISLRDERGDLARRKIRARRERRVLLPLPPRDRLSSCKSLYLDFTPDQA
jgi:thioredoxin reductase